MFQNFNDDIMLHMSDYLNFKDFKKLQTSHVHLKNLLKDKLIQKASIIIIKFMLRTRYIKNILYNKMNCRYPNMSSIELALYYFFFYENVYTENWLKGFHCDWKKNIIQSYNICVCEKVNKYHLFHVQKKMKPDEIYNIGW